MEFEWGYAAVSIILWAIFVAFWWGLFPVLGDKSYLEIFGLTKMVMITVILLPLSYFIVYFIAER